MTERLDAAVKAWREVPEAARSVLRTDLRASALDLRAAERDGVRSHTAHVLAFHAHAVERVLALLDAAEEETP